MFLSIRRRRQPVITNETYSHSQPTHIMSFTPTCQRNKPLEDAYHNKNSSTMHNATDVATMWQSHLLWIYHDIRSLNLYSIQRILGDQETKIWPGVVTANL